MQQHLAESLTYIRSRYQKKIKVVMILGSGLGQYVDLFENTTIIPYKDIPHFPESLVAGHDGKLVFMDWNDDVSVAFMQGRVHFYENAQMERVVYPIRVLKLLGAEYLLVSNAAGGVNPKFNSGDLMVINDHLNLMGVNPLMGKNDPELGPRFPDMTEPYDLSLIRKAMEISDAKKLHLKQGVYAALTGPSYETPAEVRMLGYLGADAVGMSTVPEVIVANHMGMKVFGVSCISNKAAGLAPEKLSHEEVLRTGEVVKHRLWTLFSGLVEEIIQNSFGEESPLGDNTFSKSNANV
ncbi:MAG: purine-nucleoside phosphorylase [Cyanobacteria bacterium]|nr:purine-nucleoside phosphorylase [Cyanobacteriota bacterium]